MRTAEPVARSVEERRLGPNVIPLFSTHHGPSDLGHTFVVIDPLALGEPGTFESRLEGYLDELVAAPTIPGAPRPRS